METGAMHWKQNLRLGRWVFSLTALLTAICTLTISLSGCQTAIPAPAKLDRIPALPQDPLIQTYMNHNEAVEYTELDRPITRSGDNLEQIIIDGINSAQTRLQIAVQEFRLPRIAQALADRARAGVKISVILENQYSTPYSLFTPAQILALPKRERQRYDNNKAVIDTNKDGTLDEEEIQKRDALIVIDRAGISRMDDRSGTSGLMHHKFMIIDDKQTIVTSANWTPSDIHGDILNLNSRGNANNLVKINSSEIANAFQTEFNLMWEKKQFKRKKGDRLTQTFMIGNSTVQLHFSPTEKWADWTTSSNGLVAETLTTAKTSVDLALFVFSDVELSAKLAPLTKKPIAIRGLFDPGFMMRPYSKSLDMLGLNVPCQGKNSNPWNPPAQSVGVPKLPPGDLLHHKFAIVDRSRVVLGSHNWTHAANHTNDETLLVVTNPQVAAHYQQEFDRLSKMAKFGVDKRREICKKKPVALQDP